MRRFIKELINKIDNLQENTGHFPVINGYLISVLSGNADLAVYTPDYKKESRAALSNEEFDALMKSVENYRERMGEDLENMTHPIFENE